MSSNYEDRENSYGFEREYERAMPGRGGRRMQRRKICRFCMDKVDLIDFKDVKILQRRISGACAAHQRMLAEAIKRARNIALLPYAAD
jgi:small subunit ribosomal protein S18